MRDPNAKTITNTALVNEMRARRAARRSALPAPPKSSARPEMPPRSSSPPLMAFVPSSPIT
jgi:hypothetical protein